MRKIALLALFALTSCVHTSPLTLSDGQQGYRVDCNGTAFSITDCYEEAGKICGSKGYNIYGGGNESTPYYIANGSFSANQFGGGGGFSASSGSIVNRSLVIGCKK